METMQVSALRGAIGSTVRVCGWVNSIRNQKKMQFLVLRDETGLVQALHERAEDALEAVLQDLTVESAVVIRGTVVENAHARLGGIEIVLEAVEIVGHAESGLPIDEKSGEEFRLDWRFLDLRKPENHLVFAVQTTVEAAMREHWLGHGFLEIHSPKLVGGATESGAELFRLPYFGKEASLAQSPQFYKQMAMAAGFGRVFEIGPVFRANPSFTSRHDTEFTSVDMEMSWITSHEDVMAFEERWLEHVIGRVHEQHGAAIRERFGVEVVVPAVPFPRVTMAEAHEILARKEHLLPAEDDLNPEGERLLAAHVQETLGHEFVFVTDYPTEVRPFYHMRHAESPSLTKSFDLIWKGIEVTTGAQREHRLAILRSQAKEKGVSVEAVKFYLDFFRYGCPPHGGFGFGLTRMLMVMLGRRNVREVTYLYRGPHRLTP